MPTQATTNTTTIPLAQGGPITTRTLQAMMPAARRAPYEMSVELGEFMLQNFAPILEELIHRRLAMDVIHAASTPGNVVDIKTGTAAPA